jgi:hypothetical protein
MTASPRELVHAWFQEIWNEGDDTAIDRLMAPRAVFHGLPSPDGRPIVGPAEFKPFFQDFRRGLCSSQRLTRWNPIAAEEALCPSTVRSSRSQVGSSRLRRTASSP